ncbi:MAG: hypothetical protein KC462_08615 [Cyanobacteria bacterium HKST-UBA05]|nr:hypothetical protein [Cyanobacteria bacterium HKST-UBA05]
MSYESKLKVLDEILGVQTPMQTSTFTHATEDLHQLCEAAQNVPNWILTYGNHQLTLEHLVALVKEHAGDRTVVGFAKSYKHLSHVSQRTQNQELLVLALNG